MTPINVNAANDGSDPDKSLISRILGAISGARSNIGADITHNVDRLVSFLQKPQESGLSAGRKVNQQITEDPGEATKAAIELTDPGAALSGLIEGDPLMFGTGAAGMMLPGSQGPFFRRILGRSAPAESVLSASRKVPAEELERANLHNRRLAERMGGDVNVKGPIGRAPSVDRPTIQLNEKMTNLSGEKATRGTLRSGPTASFDVFDATGELIQESGVSAKFRPADPLSEMGSVIELDVLANRLGRGELVEKNVINPSNFRELGKEIFEIFDAAGHRADAITGLRQEDITIKQMIAGRVAKERQMSLPRRFFFPVTR